MKRNFTNENFEDFLRQSADGLRMRPSNKVWQNISDHLNQKRRKVGFAIGGFLLALSTIAYFVIEGSTKNSNSFHTTKTSGQSSSTLLKQDATQKISNSIVSRPLLSNSTSFTKENRIMAIPKSTESPALGGLGINELYRLPTFNQFTPTNEFASTIIDSWFESVNNEGVQAQAPASEEAVTYPLTIESVVNSYKPKLHKKKIGLQFYFTPTVSYRKLSENKSFLHTQPLGNPVNMSALIYDVNSMVTHKPNIGFEIGMAAKYPITRN